MNEDSQCANWAGSSAWHERLTCTATVLNDFEAWLLKDHSRHYAMDLMRYVRKYHNVLQHPGMASQLTILSKDKRRMVMSGLANLSKYLGVYDDWKLLVKKSGLRWEKKVSLDVVLDIMNTNLQDCMVWLKQVLRSVPSDYGTVLVFAALTGLRPSEAVNSTRLIVELHDSGRLSEYLNSDLMMLEHFRYPELFLRRCKNAYISFVTPKLIETVIRYKPMIKYSGLDSIIGRLGLPTKTKQLRKYHATTLREYLPTEVVDLLQGRINQSVFLRYYFKPFLHDIRDKTIRGIKPLQDELMALLP